MKKAFISSLVLVAAITLSFLSCEKEDTTSYMPTWKGFNVVPRPVPPGDSVTVTACQDQIGHLIYKAMYNWTVTYHMRDMNGADSTVTKTFNNSVVYDNDPSDPSIRFLVPMEVTRDVSVSFQGRYMYSGQGSSASDGSTIQTGFDGMLRRTQSSALEGFSSGSVTIRIK